MLDNHNTDNQVNSQNNKQKGNETNSKSYSNKSEELINNLIETLVIYNTEKLIEIIEEIGNLNDARAITPLIKALGIDDENVRLAAAKALGKLGEDKWKNIIKGDIVDFYRLGELNDSRVVEPLLKAFDSYTIDVLKLAAGALAKQKDPRIVEFLIKEGNVFGRHQNAPSVRIAIIEALGELKDTSAVEPLIKFLKEYNEDVSKVAAKALILIINANPSAIKLDRRIIKLIRQTGVI